MIDSHMHIFDTRLVDPHHGHLRYLPAKSASLEEFEAVARPCQVHTCLLVQPSFLKYNNSYISNHLNGGQKPLGTLGVAMVNPEMSIEKLEALHRQGYFGIRLNLVQHAKEDLRFPLKQYGRLWRGLRERKMHVEIHLEGDRLMNVLEQISPHVDKIVLDHFMKPSEGLNGFITTTPKIYKDLKRYVDLEKIWVKTSGAYRVIPEKNHAEAVKNCRDLAAMLAGILRENRLLWGSDWPFTQNAHKVEGETAAEKYATIAITRDLWSEGGERFDPDAAFGELTEVGF